MGFRQVPGLDYGVTGTTTETLGIGKGGGSGEMRDAQLRKMLEMVDLMGNSAIWAFSGVPSGSVGFRRVPQRPISATHPRPPRKSRPPIITWRFETAETSGIGEGMGSGGMGEGD